MKLTPYLRFISDSETEYGSTTDFGGQIAPKAYFPADDEKYGKDQIHGGIMGDYESKTKEAWTYEPDDGFCPYCDQPVDWHDFDNHVNAHRENGDMRLPELAGDYQGDNVEQIS